MHEVDMRQYEKVNSEHCLERTDYDSFSIVIIEDVLWFLQK